MRMALSTTVSLMSGSLTCFLTSTCSHLVSSTWTLSREDPKLLFATSSSPSQHWSHRSRCWTCWSRSWATHLAVWWLIATLTPSRQSCLSWTTWLVSSMPKSNTLCRKSCRELMPKSSKASLMMKVESTLIYWKSLLKSRRHILAEESRQAMSSRRPIFLWRSLLTSTRTTMKTAGMVASNGSLLLLTRKMCSLTKKSRSMSSRLSVWTHLWSKKCRMILKRKSINLEKIICQIAQRLPQSQALQRFKTMFKIDKKTSWCSQKVNKLKLKLESSPTMMRHLSKIFLRVRWIRVIFLLPRMSKKVKNLHHRKLYAIIKSD